MKIVPAVLLRFSAQSVGSFLLLNGLLLMLHEGFSLNPSAAFATSLAVMFVINFFILRNFVFRTKTGLRRKQFGLMVLTIATMRSCEFLLFNIFQDQVEVHYLLLSSSILVTSAAVKFVVFQNFVFAGEARRPKATN